MKSIVSKNIIITQYLENQVVIDNEVERITEIICNATDIRRLGLTYLN